MRRAVLSTFLFTTILGLGCMGVAVPGKADELKHPKYWAGHNATTTSAGWRLQIRYLALGNKFSATLEAPYGKEGRCEGAVDKHGYLKKPIALIFLRWNSVPV